MTEEELQAIEWARRQRGRRPLQGRSIRHVVARLVTDKQYAATGARDALLTAWRDAAGPALAPYSLPGKLSRGTLHVVVQDSATMQEIMFQQAAIVQRLQARMEGVDIARIQCRVGQVR